MLFRQCIYARLSWQAHLFLCTKQVSGKQISYSFLSIFQRCNDTYWIFKQLSSSFYISIWIFIMSQVKSIQPLLFVFFCAAPKLNLLYCNVVLVDISRSLLPIFRITWHQQASSMSMSLFGIIKFPRPCELFMHHTIIWLPGRCWLTSHHMFADK